MNAICKATIAMLIGIVMIMSSYSCVLCQDKVPVALPSVLQPPQMSKTYPPDPTQTRNFLTTTLRKQVSLNGFWDFVPDREDTGEDQEYFLNFPNAETKLWVPGSWNTAAKYYQYVGSAWHRQKIFIHQSGSIQLCFGAVGFHAKVWFDGTYLGEHIGGYLPFRLYVPDVQKGMHEVIVRADNRLTETTIPKVNTGWFPYGGMYRSVYYEYVPPVYIHNVQILPKLEEKSSATITVKATVENASDIRIKKRITLFIDEAEYHQDSYVLHSGQNIIEFTVKMNAPRLWEPSNPNLYMARIVLGDEDDQFVRFGIRELSTDGHRLVLNGNPFKLKGVNHHDDHPDWGAALPPHIIRQDIEIIKRLGSNAVRCHYPPGEMFLDFCDEAGLVFMNEVPAWQLNAAQLNNPIVQKNLMNQYAEMVARDMNHPSIISWSLGNEWRPDLVEAEDSIIRMIQKARIIDDTHFITFVVPATMSFDMLEYLDIISANWKYYTWYGGPTTLEQEEDTVQNIQKLTDMHERFPDKPFIFTEFGASGSQAGWHNWGNVKWSEEFQAGNVYESARIALATDYISGGCVWQFADTRAGIHRILGPRLRGWNVKGIVDGYRQPKLAFYELQKVFMNFP